MARSLDDLLIFCLGEIAISGEHGVHPSYFPRFVHAFYESESADAAISGSVLRRTPTIDPPFLEHVWKWLTRHPDVYVGRKKEGNRLTFAEIEKKALKDDPRYRSTTVGTDVDGDGRLSQRSSLAPEDFQSLAGDDKKQLRVYVTEERMWLAVCGHAPDMTRVFQTEFTLLSIIASRREKGILQGDLVRISGQDKRSVPGRTDSLRDKGYIEKRPVLARGSRTSLLVLKKFASSSSKTLDSKGGGSAAAEDLTTSAEFIDQAALVRRIFDVTKENGLITRTDLKARLGMTVKVQWKLLSRIIRRFEGWGCLRRVNASSTKSAALNWHYPCVKFLRYPTEEEITRYCSIGGAGWGREGELDIDAEGEDDDETVQTPVGSVAGSTAPNAETLEEIGRTLPLWNPDRHLPNLVIDVIKNAGTQGITMTELKSVITGPFYSRPLDFYMGRLVENWTTAQPAHLRHLSIVRDTALDKKIAYFLHYTFENFQTLVDRGSSFWEAVVMPDRGNSKSKDMIQALLTKPDVDDFGFPITMQPMGQFRGGNATMGELMKSVDPGKWVLSGLDPVVVEVDGHDEIRYGVPQTRRGSMGTESIKSATPSRTRPSSATPRKKRGPSASASQPKRKGPGSGGPRVYKDGNKPTGRPRKYERGTEKFWRQMGQKLLRSRGLDIKGAGIMSHPLVTQMIQNRPPNFDETYLRALENGAPVPNYPMDVTESWVEKINSFMVRDGPGVYVAPTISVSREASQVEKLKLLVIFKSDRLQECSFSDLRRASSRYTPRVQFFTSSRAHTLYVSRDIPPSKIGPPIGWLIPTSSGLVPKPPLPAVSPTVRYFPSIAAHTIPHLGSFKRAAPRQSTASASAGLGVDKQPPSTGKKRNVSKRLGTPAGPKLGIFSVESAASSEGLGLDSSPAPTNHSQDSVVDTPTRPRRGRPRKNDIRAQGLDVHVIQPTAPGRRSLRSTITPSAKQRENLTQGSSPYQPTALEHDSPVERGSIFGSGVGVDNQEMPYLNAPSNMSPRPIKLPSSARMKTAPRISSGLLTTELASDIPDDEAPETPTPNAENGQSDQVVQSDGVSQIQSQDIEMIDIPVVRIESAVVNSAPEREQGESIEVVAADQTASHEAKDDQGNDSDATVDLGPSKFVFSQAKKQKSKRTPSTPKRSTKRIPTSREKGGSPAAQRLPRMQSSTRPQTPQRSPAHEPLTRESSQGVSTPQLSTRQSSIDPTIPNTESIVQPDDDDSQSGNGATPVPGSGSRKRVRPTSEAGSSKPDSKNLPKVQLDGRLLSKYQPRKRRKLDVWEGSVGFLRRKIITDVIDKCGGIIPFGYPLWYAYATAWHKAGRDTKPDFRTLKSAVKSLVDSGQIKQLKFSFKDPRGLMSTQAMLARPHIKVGDDVVRQLQRRIIDAYPQPYQPEEFEIDPNLRLHDGGGSSGIYHRPVTEEEERVETTHVPAAVRKAEERKRKAEFRERIRTNAIPERRPLAEKTEQPRVQRLEKIGGPHKLVRSARPDAARFNLPQTQRLLFGTGIEDVQTPSSQTQESIPDLEVEETARRQLLNDKKQKILPHSLADVPDRRWKKVDHSKAEDPALSKFIWDLEKVEKWELKKEALFDDERPDIWQFINHQIPEPIHEVSIEGPLLFEAWSRFDDNGDEYIESMPPDLNRRSHPLQAIMTPSGRTQRRRSAKKVYTDDVAVPFEEETPETPSSRTKRAYRKRKFLGGKQDSQPAKSRRVEQMQISAFDPKVLFPDTTKKISRGPQLLSQMPEELIYKLMVTFAVVRVLVGGVEKYVDFSIVNLVFPEETEQFLRDRWRTIRNKYRHVMRRYIEDFQELYLKAYAKDEVPAFDYDDIAGNDWDGIVEWAMSILEKPVRHDIEDLPLERAELEYYHKINLESATRPLRELYGYNIHITIPHKEHAMSSVPFVVPVVHGKELSSRVPSDLVTPVLSQPVKAPTTALEAIAKSWTLATVLTPEEQFSGTDANLKISTLPNYNGLLESSIKSLLASRIISNAHKSKGVAVASRAYDVSEHFLNTLSKKKVINQEMLRRALWYKTNVLDSAFSAMPPKKITFDVDAAEDGDMVAVLNLIAHDRITVRPSRSKTKGIGIPGNRYGLLDSYQTRFMDKNALRFAVELEPVPGKEWIVGNPLLSDEGLRSNQRDKDVSQPTTLLTHFPPPRGGMDLPVPIQFQTRHIKNDNHHLQSSSLSTSPSSTPSRLPFYFSIHSVFLPWIWDMLVSATVGLVAVRPGISTAELANMLTPSVDLEDLILGLTWLRDVGAVKGHRIRSDNGNDTVQSHQQEQQQYERGHMAGECWETTEWWWCVVEGLEYAPNGTR